MTTASAPPTLLLNYWRSSAPDPAQPDSEQAAVDATINFI
jgi:hypothetical protein